MRRKAVDSAIQLIRRGFAVKSSTSHDINGEKRQFSLRPTIDFSSIRGVNDAIGLFRQLVNMSVQPSLSVYSKFFGVLVKMEEYSVALYLFDEMRQRGLPLNEYTFNIMINCCCLLHRVDLGFAMLGSLFKQDLKPDVTTFNTLLKGLYLVGKVTEAHTLFEKVSTLRLCEIDDVTILTVINGLCKTGQTRSALDLLLVLEKGRRKVDVKAYNAVIDGLCKDGLVDEALQLLSKMADTGISPDVVTYNSIIYGLCALDRWNEVKYLLLVEMIDHKVHLDVTSFSILINAFCKKGKMKEAEDILEIMRCVNVYPNIVTYNGLLDRYCKEGRMGEAKDIFDSIVKGGLKPDIFSFSSLINGYCKSRNVDEAWRLFHDIPRAGLKHNVVSYSSMIHGFFLEDRFDEGWKLFKDMERNGCAPNGVTYNVIIQGLLKRKAVNKAMPFLEEMYTRGLYADTATASMLLDQLQGEGKDDNLVEMIEKVVPELRN